MCTLYTLRQRNLGTDMQGQDCASGLSKENGEKNTWPFNMSNCPSQEIEVTLTPTRPVENVVITTKGLQDRNIHILDGTTFENKGKLILTFNMGQNLEELRSLSNLLDAMKIYICEVGLQREHHEWNEQGRTWSQCADNTKGRGDKVLQDSNERTCLQLVQVPIGHEERKQEIMERTRKIPR